MGNTDTTGNSFLDMQKKVTDPYMQNLFPTTTGSTNNTTSAPSSWRFYEAGRGVGGTNTTMPSTPTTPPPASDSWWKTSEGWNSFGGVMQGLGSVANAWSAIEQNKVAKDALKFQKQAYNTNLQMQAQGLNQQIEDRYRSMVGSMGQEYVSKNYGSIEDYKAARSYNPQKI